MKLLEAHKLAVGYHSCVVGRGINFTLAKGEVMCLLGPNGSGKTTLFRTLLGILPTLEGDIHYEGKNLVHWSRLNLAQHISYVPQTHSGLLAFTVLQVVLMGRTARMSRFSTPGKIDSFLARKALENLNIGHLEQSIFNEISGGERQLVLFARALAQEAKLLILDEPTASLDFGNQIRVLDKISDLKKQGIAILMSTHQPEHAWRVADKIVLVKAGRLQATGTAQEVMTPEQLALLYDVEKTDVINCLHVKKMS